MAMTPRKQIPELALDPAIDDAVEIPGVDSEENDTPQEVEIDDPDYPDQDPAPIEEDTVQELEPVAQPGRCPFRDLFFSSCISPTARNVKNRHDLMFCCKLTILIPLFSNFSRRSIHGSGIFFG